MNNATPLTRIRNVILHVGALKTATSSIQETLFSNKMPREYVHKYYYPKCWYVNHSRVFLKMGSSDYSLQFPSFFDAIKLQLKKGMEQHLNELKQEAHANSVDTIVLSAEILSMASTEKLTDIKNMLIELCNYEPLNISIVGYVRNPISFFNSLFQELSRNIKYVSYSDFCELSDIAANMDRDFKKIIQVFGRQNMTICKFEDAVQHQYGPVGFFYEKYLNFKSTDINKIKIKRDNESMSQIATDICLFINQKIPMYNQDKTAFSGHREYGDLYLISKSISGVPFKLSKQNRYFHLNKCQETCRNLSELLGIKYSIEEMRLDIENDTEPCHIPTAQNLKQINSIFYKLDDIIQDLVIDYLSYISSTTDKNHSIENLIRTLEKKKKSFMNTLIRGYINKTRILRHSKQVTMRRLIKN